jgi:hypothetical protein
MPCLKRALQRVDQPSEDEWHKKRFYRLQRVKDNFVQCSEEKI